MILPRTFYVIPVAVVEESDMNAVFIFVVVRFTCVPFEVGETFVVHVEPSAFASFVVAVNPESSNVAQNGQVVDQILKYDRKFNKDSAYADLISSTFCCWFLI